MIIYPDSLNDYTYAWNQLLDYVDLDGNVPVIAIKIGYEITKLYVKDAWANLKESKKGTINDEIGFKGTEKMVGPNGIIENKYHVGGNRYVFDQDGKLKINLKAPVVPVKLKLSEEGVSAELDVDIKGFGVNFNVGMGK